MKILRAEHMGMCFGVRDAVALARDTASSQPVTVLGDLVHNPEVLRSLERQGVRFARQLELVDTRALMVTAHGASHKAIAAARAAGHDVIEATCPLVRHAHRAALELVREGYFPVVVGQRDHVEVRGLTGDLDEFAVVLRIEDLEAVPVRERYGVLAQTTQPPERVRDLAKALRERFPAAEVKLVDTVCSPTKQRQNAALRLAVECDVVIVVGGRHSNNTRELAASCARYCQRVYHVESASELDPAWFRGNDRVGLTAGTSTPDATIEAVARRLESFDRPDASAHDIPARGDERLVPTDQGVYAGVANLLGGVARQC